jgi:hypothetical protein
VAEAQVFFFLIAAVLISVRNVLEF